MQVFLEGQLASSLTVRVFDGLFSSPCDELTFRDTFCMGERFYLVTSTFKMDD